MIISHKLNNNLTLKDFYYGDIKKFLKKKKIKFEMFFFSHIKSQSEKNIINHASFTEKINIFFYITFKFIILLIFSKSYLGKINLKLKLKIASEFLSPKTFENFIIFNNLQKISKEKKIKNLITSFEGFSYERIIFFSFKKLKLKTNLLGYQHASIIRSQNGIFRKLKKEFNPDVILTSGQVTKKILKRYYPSRSIYILGSNKVSYNLIKKEKFQKNILVLPEGIETECLYMMKFISKIDFKDKKINFIFRLHPSLNFDQLKKKYDIFNTQKKNIIFSKKSLVQDIKNSKYCLYRGTTSVINCVINNLYPIFLKKKNCDDINIFYNQRGIPKVIKPQDLIKIIKTNKYTVLDRKIKTFSKEYFTKINLEVLLNFI